MMYLYIYKMPFKDKSKKIENRVKYAKDRKQHTIDSITSGIFIKFFI